MLQLIRRLMTENSSRFLSYPQQLTSDTTSLPPRLLSALSTLSTNPADDKHVHTMPRATQRSAVPLTNASNRPCSHVYKNELHTRRHSTFICTWILHTGERVPLSLIGRRKTTLHKIHGCFVRHFPGDTMNAISTYRMRGNVRDTKFSRISRMTSHSRTFISRTFPIDVRL